MIKYLFYYILGLLTWLILVYTFLKYAPDQAKYVFFDIVDIEITIEYE